MASFETKLTDYGFTVYSPEGLPIITLSSRHRARTITAHLNGNISTAGLEEFAPGYVPAHSGIVRHVSRWPL